MENEMVWYCTGQIYCLNHEFCFLCWKVYTCTFWWLKCVSNSKVLAILSALLKNKGWRAVAINGQHVSLNSQGGLFKLKYELHDVINSKDIYLPIVGKAVVQYRFVRRSHWVLSKGVDNFEPLLECLAFVSHALQGLMLPLGHRWNFAYVGLGPVSWR